MYIPYQFLMAIENDRLRHLERHQLRQTAARPVQRTRRLRGALGRRVTRVPGRRTAAGAVA